MGWVWHMAASVLPAAVEFFDKTTGLCRLLGRKGPHHVGAGGGRLPLLPRPAARRGRPLQEGELGDPVVRPGGLAAPQHPAAAPFPPAIREGGG